MRASASRSDHAAMSLPGTSRHCAAARAIRSLSDCSGHWAGFHKYTAIVGHDASDGDAEAFVIRHSCPEKGNSAVRRLIGLDLGEGDAGMIVNAHVDEIPTGAAALIWTRPIAGDAVADTRETPELFDVDVNDLAWALALIAALRLGRLEIAYPV